MLTIIIYRMDTQQGPNEEYEKECVYIYICRTESLWCIAEINTFKSTIFQ